MKSPLGRLLDYIHRRRYHKHYYIDWPYAVPAVLMSTCEAPKPRNCGYHWERPAEGPVKIRRRL